MTLDQITAEQAITRGHLWVLVSKKRWWLVRRNGKTKTWATRPGEFRIPFKAGLRAYGYITNDSQIGLANPQDLPDFLVTASNPNGDKS